MPGRSGTRPPRMSTTECSWRLWPMPGMYVVTSCWFVSRTRAIFRSAEFGFLGVIVLTWMQTPRRCGFRCRCGDLLLERTADRPRRTSWLIVGISSFLLTSNAHPGPHARCPDTYYPYARHHGLGSWARCRSAWRRRVIAARICLVALRHTRHR